MYQDTRISLLECGCKQIELGGTIYLLDDSVAVSRGGSCLVYRAVKKDQHTHLRDQKVILKEFYPAHEDAGQWRKEHGWLELPREVEAGRTKFEKSYERFIALCNQDMDVNTTKAHSTLAAPVGNSVFLEMEYSSGITLDAYMEKCSLFDFFIVMQNLAGVIGALHGNGYIHMDIKPANILCLASDPHQPEFRNITRLLDTDSFIWKGAFSEEEPHIVLSVTPKYAAPEAKELLIKQKDFADSIPLLEIFEKVGDRVDQYSMGAIIFEYIFGSCPAVPYDEDHSYEERLEESLHKRLRYIPYKAISLIRNLLKRTLAKDPYDRYETMSEIAAEIEKNPEAD